VRKPNVLRSFSETRFLEPLVKTMEAMGYKLVYHKEISKDYFYAVWLKDKPKKVAGG